MKRDIVLSKIGPHVFNTLGVVLWKLTKLNYYSHSANCAKSAKLVKFLRVSSKVQEGHPVE